jgi:hypothetical protein
MAGQQLRLGAGFRAAGLDRVFEPSADQRWVRLRLLQRAGRRRGPKCSPLRHYAAGAQERGALT